MTPEELDTLILANADPLYFRKVALIVGTVGASLPGDSDENYNAVAARIVALVAVGKLEAQGDISKWRHSEVRLSQS